MSGCRRLMWDMFDKRCDRAERTEQARTDDLIDEAEHTRRELSRITGRLTAHVAALKVLTAAYARHQQEGSGG